MNFLKGNFVLFCFFLNMLEVFGKSTSLIHMQKLMTVNHNVLPFSRVFACSPSKTALVLSAYVEFQESISKGERHLCVLEGVIFFPILRIKRMLLK